MLNPYNLFGAQSQTETRVRFMREMGPGLAGKVGSTSGPETGRLRDRWHRRRKKEGLSPDVKEEGLDAEREAMMAEKAKQEDTDQQAA